MMMKKKEHRKHILLFVLFSISAGIIQAICFSICKELLKMTYGWSYFIALSLSVIWNFTLNRKITFKSAANIPIAMMKVAAFYLIFTPLSTWLGDLATKDGANEYFVLGITMLSNLILEFLYTKYYVYKNQINTADKTSTS